MPWTQQLKTGRPPRSVRVTVPNVRVDRPKQPPKPPKPPDTPDYAWRWRK